MSDNYLNPVHLKKINSYKKQFAKANPFPFIQINDILIPKKANLLLEEIKKEEFIEKESDLFQIKQTHDLHFAKSKLVKDFHKSLLTWDFFNFITSITGKQFEGTLNCAATKYDATDFLLCHDDKLDGRKIAFLFYLSKGFTLKDGGSLNLFSTKNKLPDKIVKKITPEFNSLVLFEVSSKSYHEVEENYSGKSRYTIGGWLK